VIGLDLLTSSCVGNAHVPHHSTHRRQEPLPDSPTTLWV
jgi:hypothetical protein